MTFGQDINPKKRIDKSTISDNIIFIMTKITEILKQSRKEAYLMFLNCDKNDFLFRTQLKNIQNNLRRLERLIYMKNSLIAQIRRRAK